MESWTVQKHVSMVELLIRMGMLQQHYESFSINTSNKMLSPATIFSGFQSGVKDLCNIQNWLVHLVLLTHQKTSVKNSPKHLAVKQSSVLYLCDQSYQ